MPGSGWRCSACGCGSAEIERARALAGRPALDTDALACGQRCALALVEREIETAAQVLARAGAGGSPVDGGDEVEAVAQVPHLEAYVAVMAMTAGEVRR